MKFFALFVSAFAALVAADSPNPISSPSGGVITAGTATTITWSPTTSGTITLQLRSGNPGALSAGTVIASSIPNSGSYPWTPSTSIPTGSDYTIEIIDDADTSEVNYSPMFTIEGGSSASTTTSGSSESQTSSASLPSLSASTSKTASSNSTVSTSSTSKSSSSASSKSTSSGSTSTSGSTAPSSNAGPYYGRGEGIIAAIVGIGAVVALA